MSLTLYVLARRIIEVQSVILLLIPLCDERIFFSHSHHLFFHIITPHTHTHFSAHTTLYIIYSHNHNTSPPAGSKSITNFIMRSGPVITTLADDQHRLLKQEDDDEPHKTRRASSVYSQYTDPVICNNIK
jgi:hypothetical protein